MDPEFFTIVLKKFADTCHWQQQKKEEKEEGGGEVPQIDVEKECDWVDDEIDFLDPYEGFEIDEDMDPDAGYHDCGFSESHDLFGQYIYNH